MLNTPFSPWPHFTFEEAEKINEVLLSNKVNYWTGTECTDFEKEFATWCEAKYAIALMNGTVALEIALQVLNLQPQDEVIVTPRTFIASISAIIRVGATPVFADVDPDSQNITAATIQAALTPRTKAIVCVHLAGWPCDMDSIMDLAKDKGLMVIEDCAQAHGARYKGRSVGSLGHIAAWSFCQDKIMSTGGEGGMITTNDSKLWSLMWSFKDHGKSFEATRTHLSQSGFRWLHHSFGTNGRMLELQAALGRLQLQKLQDWHKMRLANAMKIWQVARTLTGLRVPIIPEYIEHAAYKCYVFIDLEALKPGWDRERVIAAIHRFEVPCYSGSCSEVYLEKAFETKPFKPRERLKTARLLGDSSLMFLVHPTLTAAEIQKTCHALQSVMQQATKVNEDLAEMRGISYT